jgi:hypothetical protein
VDTSSLSVATRRDADQRRPALGTGADRHVSGASSTATLHTMPVQRDLQDGRQAGGFRPRLEMIAESHSRSELLSRVLFGPVLTGDVYGRAHLRFGDYVVSITRPGSARMPNGIECDVKVRLRDRVAVGNGRLVVGRTVINPGPEWDPAPSFKRQRVLPAGPEPLVSVAVGGADRFMRSSDVVIAGYLAGLVLLHGQRERAHRLAEAAAARANPLSATMFRHAALGEVPEPVHALFTTGEPRHVLVTPDPSGTWWLRGLLSAGFPVDVAALWSQSAAGAS